MFKRKSCLALLFICLICFTTNNLRADQNPDWTTPMAPYRIAGNLYYVGSRDLASYLVTTPQGLILINSNLTSSGPQIRRSVEKLGFRFSDIKILLISHAHYDHCAGSSAIKKLTGAKYMVMDADVPVIESGGKGDFQYGAHKEMLYPATKVDRILHDGEEVRLGNVVLVAHRTAGHTKGCTTWTLKVLQNGKNDSGKTYNVVIVGSPNVNPGYKLVNNPKYPKMAADFAHQFRILKALPCDIFLGAHGSYYDMLAKYARLQAGDAMAFVDPSGYQGFVAERQKAFEAELARQKQTERK
ncbi:subclass B3 metallo-beta-lactamase [Acidicapsa ligni]|uniref:subclass B3 metallo-beta-lactamase n=1 Tax=Acidicapsa ligni TaxID=542300 RepID=UPI0021E050B2|nr:subclass B3 metallo-beta-lactamase [Acidicapsa ligni]